MQIDIPQVPPREEYLTPKQVSALLRIAEGTLAAWRSTDRVKLPYVKIGGAVRYRRSDVELLLVQP